MYKCTHCGQHISNKVGRCPSCQCLISKVECLKCGTMVGYWEQCPICKEARESAQTMVWRFVLAMVPPVIVIALWLLLCVLPIPHWLIKLTGVSAVVCIIGFICWLIYVFHFEHCGGCQGIFKKGEIVKVCMRCNRKAHTDSECWDAASGQCRTIPYGRE